MGDDNVIVFGDLIDSFGCCGEMIGCGIVRASRFMFMFMFIPAGLDVDEVSQRNAAHARSACAWPLLRMRSAVDLLTITSSSKT